MPGVAYRWEDDEIGEWMTVREESDSVVVAPMAKPRWVRAIPRAAGVVMLIFIVYLLLDLNWGLSVALAGAVVIVIFHLELKRPLPETDDKDWSIRNGFPPAGEVESDRVLWSSQVEMIILRRNGGYDDGSWWQVYLKISGLPYARLVYQDWCSRNGWRRARDVARRFARRWEVEVVEPDRRPDDPPDQPPPRLTFIGRIVGVAMIVSLAAFVPLAMVFQFGGAAFTAFFAWWLLLLYVGGMHGQRRSFRR